MEAGKGKTRLHGWHVGHGANMADFGGYEMPLWYPGGAKNEHMAVIQGAGIFDTSHMAVVTVDGKGAFTLIQQCFSKDLACCVGLHRKPLETGRCVYGVFLDENGHVIDDALVYQLADEHYMICVNAGMGGPIADHLGRYSGSLDVVITDMTGRLAKMDVQGPASAKVLGRILDNPADVLQSLPYFSFRGHFATSASPSGDVRLKSGAPLLLSRTGYTGEFGFEIFIAPEHIVRLWEDVLDAGEEYSLVLCGLAARDSLRAGSVLPLSHQDIGDWPFLNHPWVFALPYDESGAGFTKPFVGSEALRKSGYGEYTYPFAGYDLRKISGADSAFVSDESGEAIGKILTCATDMAIGRVDGKIFSAASPDKPEGFRPKGLCCGFVKVEKQMEPGQIVFLNDGKRRLKVEIVEDVRPARTARRKLQDMLG